MADWIVGLIITYAVLRGCWFVCKGTLRLVHTPVQIGLEASKAYNTCKAAGADPWANPNNRQPDFGSIYRDAEGTRNAGLTRLAKWAR